MHIRMTAAAFAAGLFTVASVPVAVTAEESCLDTQAVLEKIGTPGITANKLTEPQIKELQTAFNEAHPGQKMAAGNHALVFHRKDAPVIDWLVLFVDGCAKYELPVDSRLVQDVMDGAYVDPAGNFDSFAPAAAP